MKKEEYPLGYESIDFKSEAFLEYLEVAEIPLEKIKGSTFIYYSENYEGHWPDLKEKWSNLNTPYKLITDDFGYQILIF